MDLAHAYLCKVQREARISELIASIRSPQSELDTPALTDTDIDALATAIERCTPDEVAAWIVRLVSGFSWSDV